MNVLGKETCDSDINSLYDIICQISNTKYGDF